MSAGERLDVRPAYFALARELCELLVARFDLARAGRAIIGIAGESGSGKSVTATCLAQELGASGIPAAVVHQDDYFHRPPRANHEHRCRDLASVGPHEVDLARLAAHVEAFHAGRDGVDAPRVDRPSDSFVTRRLDFGGVRALIVEGTYVLRLSGLDVRIFLEATHEDTRERRRARNRDVDAPIIDEILTIEHAVIAPQAELADVLIDKDFRVRER